METSVPICWLLHALAKGYYREAGLDVKIVEAQPAQDPTETVLQGNTHFGVGASELVLLQAQGQPVVALAVIFQHSSQILLARRNCDLNHLHDLIGKRVMIEPGSADLLAYLQREGISRETWKSCLTPLTRTPLSMAVLTPSLRM